MMRVERLPFVDASAAADYATTPAYAECRHALFDDDDVTLVAAVRTAASRNEIRERFERQRLPLKDAMRREFMRNFRF